MSTRYRYYNSKRGNGFRGRGRGRGRRGTSLTAISLPRDDRGNAEYLKDRPMDANTYRDESVLCISFAQKMLGAAYYEQSTQLIKIMNDIHEDHEFKFLIRLLEDTKPTMIITNRSQDLEYIKFLSSKYEMKQKLEEDATETTVSTTWDASIACSTDSTTIPEERDEDEDPPDAPLAKLFKLPNNFFKMPRALDRLKMMVGSENSSMTDEDKLTIVKMRFDLEAVNMMRSFGALLLFLDESRLGVENEPLSVTSPIKSIKTLKIDSLVDIDFNTMQALEIMPSDKNTKKQSAYGRSLYSIMDRCRSSVGKKCLQKWFRNPTTDREELISRQKCVHFFKQDWNAEVTAKVATTLGKVRGLNNVFQRFRSGTAQLIHWECFISTVNALVEIMDIIKQTVISSELTVESYLLREVSEIAVITGSIINFAESKIQGRVTVMPGIDEELDRLRAVYEEMPMVLTAIAKQEAARLGIESYSDVSCVYVPLVGFILSLPKDFDISYHSDMSLVYATSEEVRVRNETTARLDDQFGDILVNMIDNQTAIILTLKTTVMKKQRNINTLLSIASRIDALISLGLVAAENKWNCPTLLEEPVIEATELFHPISALIVKKSFVPNQVSSGKGGTKISIIAGPNACGKSIYMKSIGILAFLTHIGSYVPARCAKVGLVDRIVTRMFTVDSVLDGMSTFAMDVEQVALALRKATGSSLVIIDEFGKGTMTEVGLSLLASCMNHWIRKGEDGCPHVFLSSHFHAIPRYIIQDTDLICYLTFVVHREPGGKIRYLFQLVSGLVDCSFAMAVAKEEGIPMSVIGRACTIYKALQSGTKLKHIRADVPIDDVDDLISGMDVVLDDETTFIDSIESFVNKNKSSKNFSSDSQNEDLESEHISVSRAGMQREVEKLERARSAVSTVSKSSVNQLSTIDALLPKKKQNKITNPENEPENESDISMEFSRSPDPFSECFDEDNDGRSDQNPDDVSKAPTNSSSVREILKTPHTSALSQSTAHEKKFESTPKEKKMIGTKRARSPSTSLNKSNSEAISSSNQIVYHNPEDLFKTPKHSTRDDLFMEPKSFSEVSNVIEEVDQFSNDSIFKTPKVPKKFLVNTVLRSSNSRSDHRNTSKSSFINNAPQSQRSCNNYLNSPHGFQNVSESHDSQRSSSRREMRADCEPDNSFFESQISIFNSQQSRNSSQRQDGEQSSIHNFIFGTKTTKNTESQDFVFNSPKTSIFDTPWSGSPQKSDTSRQSVSPSSIILQELARGYRESTPLPLGDESISDDFRFSQIADDPFYRKNDPNNNNLLSDDESDNFLTSFLEGEKSLKIDSSFEK